MSFFDLDILRRSSNVGEISLIEIISATLDDLAVMISFRVSEKNSGANVCMSHSEFQSHTVWIVMFKFDSDKLEFKRLMLVRYPFF